MSDQLPYLTHLFNIAGNELSNALEYVSDCEQSGIFDDEDMEAVVQRMNAFLTVTLSVIETYAEAGVASEMVTYE